MSPDERLVTWPIGVTSTSQAWCGMVLWSRYYILTKNAIITFIRIHKYIILLNYNEFLYNSSISTFYGSSKLHVSLSRWVRVRLTQIHMHLPFIGTTYSIEDRTAILTSSCHIWHIIFPSSLKDFAAFLFFGGFLFFRPRALILGTPKDVIHKIKLVWP